MSTKIFIMIILMCVGIFLVFYALCNKRSVIIPVIGMTILLVVAFDSTITLYNLAEDKYGDFKYQVSVDNKNYYVSDYEIKNGVIYTKDIVSDNFHVTDNPYYKKGD